MSRTQIKTLLDDQNLEYLNPYWVQNWTGLARVVPEEKTALHEEALIKINEYHTKNLKKYSNDNKLLCGTDTFNPFILPGFTVHDELQSFVDDGLTSQEALLSATKNVGLYLGIDWGEMKEGYEADILVLNANPLEEIRNTKSIFGVFYNGIWYNREKLDKILSDTKAIHKKKQISFYNYPGILITGKKFRWHVKNGELPFIHEILTRLDNKFETLKLNLNWATEEFVRYDLSDNGNQFIEVGEYYQSGLNQVTINFNVKTGNIKAIGHQIDGKEINVEKQINVKYLLYCTRGRYSLISNFLVLENEIADLDIGEKKNIPFLLISFFRGFELLDVEYEIQRDSDLEYSITKLDRYSQEKILLTAEVKGEEMNINKFEIRHKGGIWISHPII